MKNVTIYSPFLYKTAHIWSYFAQKWDYIWSHPRSPGAAQGAPITPVSSIVKGHRTQARSPYRESKTAAKMQVLISLCALSPYKRSSAHPIPARYNVCRATREHDGLEPIGRIERIRYCVRGETVMSGVPVLNTQAMFYEQYEAVRRDEVVGILLALFLGTFGAHHFYLRRTGLGILYLVFFWSGIPSILGFIECFFMPGRVREFNAIQAAGIAAALGMPMPGWGQPGQPINVTVNMPPSG